MAKLIARRLWMLGWVGLLSFGGEAFDWTQNFFLLFLAPLVVNLAGWLGRRWRERGASTPHDSASDPVGFHLPMPGPAERAGALVFLLRYGISSTLALLNPKQLGQMIEQARGDSRALRRANGVPPDPTTYEQKSAYTLPFSGEWLVMNGGVTPELSHSWDIVSQRYAYDFVIADSAGRRHRGDGAGPEDYFAYGEPILAVAAGEVVATVEGVRDAPGVGTGWIDWRSRHLAGNSVTIRHAEGEYSLSAHLIPGSICVQTGEHVERGQVIGRCGHSGHSTEPHLHFQLQDHPAFLQALGLPVRFSDVALDGSPSQSPVFLRPGTRVAPSAPPSDPTDSTFKIRNSKL